MKTQTVIANRSPMKFHIVAAAFVVGAVLGYMIRGNAAGASLKQKTGAPFHISSVPYVGVSHNPEIKKQVLASKFQMPHVTQVARAYIGVGQVASENWHKDMAEMFIFESGDGILNLDGVNQTIGEGSVALVYPPTKHTIYNTGTEKNLNVLVIASVP